jgi:hypothetical protein
MQSAHRGSSAWRSAAAALWLACGPALAADPLLWFDGVRPGAQSAQAVELLTAAASHGLEPQDYGAAAP